MRHLWSLLAGLAAAPLAWLLLAVGQHNAQQRVAGWEQAGFFSTAQLIWPVIVLGLAGLGLGVLATLRWSPAGPAAAGVLLVLPTIFMFGNPFRTLDFFSYGQTRRLFGQDLAPWLPIENGTLLVIGTLLLVAVASRQRWRQWPLVPTPIPPATDQQVIDGIGELTRDSGKPPMSDDEILAAAAAMDEQREQAEQTEPEEPEQAEPEEPEQAEPGGPKGSSDSAEQTAPGGPKGSSDSAEQTAPAADRDSPRAGS
jgi:hypothetical protein